MLKNVTGLDLCKLLAGSHGTLGVITEVTLKVLPAPECTGSIAIAAPDAAEGVRLLSAALGSPYGVSAACWLPREAARALPELAGFDAAVALVRIEDFATSVDYRTRRLVEALGAGDAHHVGDTASRAAWRAIRDVLPLAAQPGEAVWRVSVRPSSGPTILQATGLRGFLDWGGGLVWLAGDPASHAAVVQAVTATGGTWTLMRGPDPMRTAVDVIPPEPPAPRRDRPPREGRHGPGRHPQSRPTRRRSLSCRPTSPPSNCVTRRPPPPTACSAPAYIAACARPPARPSCCSATNWIVRAAAST